MAVPRLRRIWAQIPDPPAWCVVTAITAMVGYLAWTLSANTVGLLDTGALVRPSLPEALPLAGSAPVVGDGPLPRWFDARQPVQALDSERSARAEHIGAYEEEVKKAEEN